MPESGCRQLANVFNRRFAHHRRMTVGKTFVSRTIRAHQYDIQVLRQKIKHRPPRPVAPHLIWGMDLTGKRDAQRNTHPLLGIVEHHSRANLELRALQDKTTVTVLRSLLDAIERFGRPTIIRTDNEASFTSLLFRFGLFLLGVRHQRIDPGRPWQNGRVERFFGTLKDKLNQWEVSCLGELNGALHEFRFWYNHVRTHQYLDGRTPAEVWDGVDIYIKRAKKEYWFEAWDGLLTGFYLRH